MINLGTSTMQDFALGDNLVECIDLGDTTIFDPYTTLTGTLPLSFNSRVAGALKNYRIYGTSAGSGTPTESGEPAGYKIPISLESGVTENILSMEPDAWEQGAILNGGELPYSAKRIRQKAQIEIKPSTTYCVEVFGDIVPAWHLWEADGTTYISDSGWQTSTSPIIFTTPVNAGYIRFTARKLDGNASFPLSDLDGTRLIMLTEGSTAPDHYIPHRYTSNYDLFIGDSKLGATEYLDFSEQKIYKDVAGTLTPTDPPVAFPAITTYLGENTLSSTETVGDVSVKGRIYPMYRQVEYLKSTGTQYIDTDIISTYSTKTELDIKFSDIVASADSDHSYFFGISGASALGVYNALLQRRTSNDVEDICVYDGFYYSAGGMSLLENLSVKTRNILTINRPTSSWGSTTVSTDKTITAVTPTVGLCIFGLKAISGGQQVFLTQTSRNMFLYECKIYLNGSTLSNDLIPVERYDGVLGLYDKITGKFYTNTGTGEFVKGEYV